MDKDVQSQLLAMWQHPDLEEFFRLPQSQHLTQVLEELARFGPVVLGAHDERQLDGSLQSVWVCSLRLRLGPTPPLLGAGAVPELAALRCLVEAVCQLRREVRGLDYLR